MNENPLKQYFRRPAVYFKLPSNGEGYPEGVIDFPENKELPVYPMTSIDEITARTPDALFNGSAIVEIIKSCIPNIKDPWRINSIDLDPILVAIRAATYGTSMEINTTCPSCKETASYDVNLTTMMSRFTAGSYNTPLTIGDIKIKFSPMPFTEMNKASLAQFQIQKTMQMLVNIADDADRNAQSIEAMKTINNTYLDIIIQMIEYVKTPDATVLDKSFIKEFLLNTDKNTYDKVRDYTVQLRAETELKPLDVTCPECSHAYEQSFTVNATDFFGQGS